MIGNRYWLITVSKVAICFALALLPSLAHAESTGFKQLSAEYFKLRNTDAGRDSSVEGWRQFVHHAETSLSATQEKAEQQRIKFWIASAFVRIGIASDEESLLKRAKEKLDQILADGGEAAWTPESEVLRGDIAILLEEGEAVALNFYKSAAEAPDVGWGSVIAESRISSVKNGTFHRFKPDSALFIPRIVPTRIIPAAGKGRRPAVVVIDPGHGGEDSGAKGKHKLVEKNLSLAISKMVQSKFSANKDIAVILTRDVDRFVPLHERTALANDLQADLFISIHSNASPEGTLSGLESYVLDTEGDEASKKLAERENGPGLTSGDDADLAFIISDVIQTGKIEDSLRLSENINRSISERLNRRWPKAVSRGTKKGPFYVLVGAHMPCVLVEIFFIDNNGDALFMSSPEFRTAVADGIADGIKSSVKRH